MTAARRGFIKGTLGLSAMAALYGCAGAGKGAKGHVVVVGGGYGGATAAKYISMWSEGGIRVTLVERNAAFVSCPISNLVLAGEKQLSDITVGYEGLAKYGITVVQDEVTAVDAEKRMIRLARGGDLAYDRLVLSPGVEFMYESLPGMASAAAKENILHAWKAGPQTVALRKQLEAMPDGGVFAMTIPKAPYRCPPGPYERACMVAHYLKQAKPKSKVLVLDANEEIVSKKGLFTKAWADSYKGMIEYRPQSELRDVDAGNRTAILEFDQVKANVLNVVPPQRAGDIAANSGLKLINNRWVDINWLTMESTSTPNIHVLGDAIFPAPTMPKSGHMANQHAKVAAAAIINLMSGQPPSDAPLVMNTCYSFVDATNVVHVASVHPYDAATRQPQPVKGAGGLSAAPTEMEGKYALAWARNIWADMLT
ncbi:NAD(P)/FAD-dependent oxidoreductase [Methyloversatilis sp.]|uniref:NAD(P)/FAD-dependent oxidoreductase n=1 Tax=Methyloversatilis sp. TaxID=2569862 RepID=UPI002732529A|nr:NAD(P)/FAD-dependent oxidoreductase [Methyloversatilis sp.]MDP2869675.1 NAD(P)/FAD-dependent oxidoreductase [Methyloversatilis sp.]MDP3287092.1 NAD(P)/FAD-dependent oxidoreductase [Methyloversatilis sp.]MDP3456313.1 NAD(P)/FAD-dependent oxidoreductase [Methyloversatilis sp.]MDP3579447.1 NAD(P)/FAD-dependent oxidoreductase [Methyloversatilis sp.]